VHFLVLEAVADVAVPELIRVQAVEKLEAGPGERAQHRGFFALAQLQAPAAAGLVALHCVEDVFQEGGVVLVQQRLLLFLLHVSEMLVAAELHRLLLVEAAERLGSAQFVLGRHLKGADGARVAVIFNCVDDVGETMHLRQVALGHLNFLLVTLFGVLVLLWRIRVFLILLGILSRHGLLFLFCALFLIKQLVWLSKEVSGA